MAKKKLVYPIYENNREELKTGLYLGLFHGFKNETERRKAQDWGAQGAMIGPLHYAHTTYACELHILFVDEKDAKKYGIDSDYDISINKDGCIEFDGMQYGDWTVFYHTQGEKIEL